MLHALSPAAGATKKRKRIARGSSAGGGTTAGRGAKGQQARAGKGRRFGFEGGQVPLIRRQPKLGGFRNPSRREYEVVNIGVLEARLSPGAYDVVALRGAGLLTTRKPVKLLGQGSVTKKFELSVHATSKSARAAIEKAGGSVKKVPVS
ncbi:MAG: 50S ribosomal protein L15 [Candidatus Peribacteraceae bacterium]|nr:50S ribosomal protein L15 [Candidatus Peribacteraceae bacterium]